MMGCVRKGCLVEHQQSSRSVTTCVFRRLYFSLPDHKHLAGEDVHLDLGEAGAPHVIHVHVGVPVRAVHVLGAEVDARLDTRGCK